MRRLSSVKISLLVQAQMLATCTARESAAAVLLQGRGGKQWSRTLLEIYQMLFSARLAKQWKSALAPHLGSPIVIGVLAAFPRRAESDPLILSQENYITEARF